MLLAQLSTIRLRHIDAYSKTLAQAAFEESLREQDHRWQDNVKAVLAKTSVEAAMHIASQVRPLFGSRLRELRLTPQDLEFSFKYDKVDEDNGVWLSFAYQSDCYCAALGSIVATPVSPQVAVAA